MTPSSIVLELLSDTALAGGSGGGQVDRDLAYDDEGFPFLHGRRLQGLLRDSFLDAAPAFPTLIEPAIQLFGVEGLLLEATRLGIHHARLDEELRSWLIHLPLQSRRAAVSTVRSSTAIDRETGAPRRNTLRSQRLALRTLQLTAPMTWLRDPTAEELAVLALAVLNLRALGSGRNRGRGSVRTSLDGDWDATVAILRGVVE